MTKQEVETLIEWFKTRRGKTLKLNDKGIDYVIDVFKRQIPIQYHHTRIDHVNDCVRVSVCPECLELIYTFKDEYPNFCTQCGQKIDWNE